MNRQTAAEKKNDGKLVKNKEARLTRWRERFEEILNKDTTESPPQDEYEEVNGLGISEETPTTKETGAALKMLRNGKTLRTDQKTTEVFKTDLDPTNKELKHTFDHILKEGKVPKK